MQYNAVDFDIHTKKFILLLNISSKRKKQISKYPAEAIRSSFSGIIMIDYGIISNPGLFFISCGILFLLLVISFLCVAVVLKTLYKRIKAASQVETIKDYILPEWVATAMGLLCIICGIGGMWAGIVWGIFEQIFFTRPYPEIELQIFEPVGVPSIVFGVLLTLVSACIFVLGIFLIIESRSRMK